MSDLQLSESDRNQLVVVTYDYDRVSPDLNVVDIIVNPIYQACPVHNHTPCFYTPHNPIQQPWNRAPITIHSGTPSLVNTNSRSPPAHQKPHQSHPQTPTQTPTTHPKHSHLSGQTSLVAMTLQLQTSPAKAQQQADHSPKMKSQPP